MASAELDVKEPIHDEPILDEPQAVEQQSVVDENDDAAPAREAEPLWDAPVVAEPAPTTPPALEASDFAEVWKQRVSPLETIDWRSIEEQSAKPGFFARLFSRKKKEEPIADEENFDDLTEREPADADFAEDAAASAVPAHDDFAAVVDDSADSPSLEHSAEDSASLAALLGSVAPVPELVEETPAIIEDTVDISLTIDAAPDPAFALEPPPAPTPVERDAKKAGFFSGLLRRVSRSQFIPRGALEAEPVTPVMDAVQTPSPIDELPAIDEVVADLPMVEPEPAVAPEELAARYGPPPVEMPDLGETVPNPMPAVPPPTFAPPVRAETDMESTHPFPAFRDARDDFAEEDAKGRSTEQVAMPAEAEGDKTDEFEAVAPPARLDATAETRQVTAFLSRMFGKKPQEAAASSGEVPATDVADDKMPFVLAKFRGFYNEVIRDKHQKSDVIAGFATAVMGAGGSSSESDPEFAAQLLSKRLSEMLELQAAESNWTGGDAAKYYPEAQFAMVALADETFATIEWPGRPSWHKYMLEPKMYGTRGADIEFFKRIDKLLKEAPNEKGARDLARLYLMVIASGYRGKFRIPNVRRPLAEYRRRLYEYSHQVDPLELYARDRRIFPQASANTLVSRSVGRFTPAQKWIAVVLILSALYIGVSHYAWTSVSADLRDVMSRIQSSISQPAPR